MKLLREVMSIQIDGRRRREENRKERGEYYYRKMLARYDYESHLTAHYFIDPDTGEPIEVSEEGDFDECSS